MGQLGRLQNARGSFLSAPRRALSVTPSATPFAAEDGASRRSTFTPMEPCRSRDGGSMPPLQIGLQRGVGRGIMAAFC